MTCLERPDRVAVKGQVHRPLRISKLKPSLSCGSLGPCGLYCRDQKETGLPSGLAKEVLGQDSERVLIATGGSSGLFLFP